MTKNVCAYSVQVLVKGISDPFTFEDAEGKPYGTLAYQTFVGGGDVQSKLTGDGSDSDIIIPRCAVAAFIWTKDCDAVTVTNDICEEAGEG